MTSAIERSGRPDQTTERGHGSLNRESRPDRGQECQRYAFDPATGRIRVVALVRHSRPDDCGKDKAGRFEKGNICGQGRAKREGNLSAERTKRTVDKARDKSRGLKVKKLQGERHGEPPAEPGQQRSIKLRPKDALTGAASEAERKAILAREHANKVRREEGVGPIDPEGRHEAILKADRGAKSQREMADRALAAIARARGQSVADLKAKAQAKAQAKTSEPEGAAVPARPEPAPAAAAARSPLPLPSRDELRQQELTRQLGMGTPYGEAASKAEAFADLQAGKVMAPRQSAPPAPAPPAPAPAAPVSPAPGVAPGVATEVAALRKQYAQLDSRVFRAQRRQLTAEPGSAAHARARQEYQALSRRQRALRARMDELRPDPNRGTYDPARGAYYTGD